MFSQWPACGKHSLNCSCYYCCCYGHQEDFSFFKHFELTGANGHESDPMSPIAWVPTSEVLCLRKGGHTLRSKCLSRRARASVSPPCQTAGPSPSVGNPTREGAGHRTGSQDFPELDQQQVLTCRLVLWVLWELNRGSWCYRG